MIKNLKKATKQAVKTLLLMLITVGLTIATTRISMPYLRAGQKLMAIDVCLIMICFISFYYYIRERIRIFKLAHFTVFAASLLLHFYFLWVLLRDVG